MWFFFLCPSWEMISLLFDYSFFDIPIFSLLINFCIGFFRTTKAVYYNTIAKSRSENCGWNVKRIKKKLSSLLYDVVAIKLVCSFSICVFFPSCRLSLYFDVSQKPQLLFILYSWFSDSRSMNYMQFSL